MPWNVLLDEPWAQSSRSGRGERSHLPPCPHLDGKSLRNWGDGAAWINLLAYADHLLLLAKSEEKLVSTYNDLRMACARFGLGWGAVMIEGHRLEPRPSMVDLGALIGGDPSAAARNLAAITSNNFWPMSGQLLTSELRFHMLLQKLRAEVLPVLVCGCEACCEIAGGRAQYSFEQNRPHDMYHEARPVFRRRELVGVAPPFVACRCGPDRG